jgi:hypothetical protein
MKEIKMLKNTRFFKRTMSGRLGKIFWILLSTVFMFVGPTYFELALRQRIPFPYLELVSVVLFVIGLYVFLQVSEEK